MKNLYLFLAGVFISFTCIAQKNFVPGFVVTPKGDTIEGLIDYKVWTKNPKSFSFKSKDGVLQTFEPNQVAYFVVSSKEIYKSSIVTKDMAPINGDKPGPKTLNGNIKDVVFLRQLVKGNKLSLYELLDEKYHYYLQVENNTPEELEYKVTVNDSDPDITITTRKYQDQLVAFADPNDKPLIGKIETSAYNAKELQKIVLQLDKTSFVYGKDPKKQKLLKPVLFAGGGIVYNNLDLGANQFMETDNMKNSNPPLSYLIKFGVDFIPVRGSQRIFLRADISYGADNYKGEKIVPTLAEQEKRTYELDVHTLTTQVSVNYNFCNNKNIKIFIGAGGGMNFSSFSKDVYSTQNLTTGSTTQQQNYLSIAFEKYWLSFHGQLGVQFKRFGLSATTLLGDGFVGFTWKNASYHNTGVVFTYRLTGS